MKLYLYFLQFSFSKALEFRFDFYFRILMDIFFYIMNIAFFKILFLHTKLIGGWSEPQVMVFVSAFLLIDAINMTVFANNSWALPDLINKGELDYYLLRPVSTLFFVSLRDFAANSFVNLLLAFVFSVYTISHYPGELAPAKIILFYILIGLGSIMRYFLRISFVIPVFWLHASQGFEMVFYNLNRFIERPDRLFDGLFRIFLTTLIPFSVMASFPTRLLVEKFDYSILIHFLIVLVAHFLFLLWFWDRGLKAYSSASS